MGGDLLDIIEHPGAQRLVHIASSQRHRQCSASLTRSAQSILEASISLATISKLPLTGIHADSNPGPPQLQAQLPVKLGNLIA